MAFELLLLSAVLAAASAGIVGPVGAPVAYAAPSAYAAPAAYAAHATYAAPLAKAVVAEEYDPHPQYSYGYNVQDSLTGDNKRHSESRDGDVVQGSYSLVDPDGTLRTVDYTADPVNGFNAVVSKQPLSVPTVAKIAAPVPAVGYATPAIPRLAAPTLGYGYAAPSLGYGYGAPVARLASPFGYTKAIY